MTINLQRLALNVDEKICFSVNEPLVLGNFSCNWIYYGKNDQQKLSSFDLSVDVEITEARTLDRFIATTDSY